LLQNARRESGSLTHRHHDLEVRDSLDESIAVEMLREELDAHGVAEHIPVDDRMSNFLVVIKDYSPHVVETTAEARCSTGT
jgi:hypothetical protein